LALPVFKFSTPTRFSEVYRTHNPLSALDVLEERDRLALGLAYVHEECGVSQAEVNIAARRYRQMALLARGYHRTVRRHARHTHVLNASGGLIVLCM